MKLAAVDIGSNAIRMQITSVSQYEGKINFKKVEYLRFPLRLGLDVFNNQKISDINRRKFIKLMKAFKILIDLYEVDDYMACATSAMRESINGKEIALEVKEEIGLKINIIDGNREAELINISLNKFFDEKTYIHIDVGGGSTELNLYKEREKVASKSFQIGSVRSLEDKVATPVWASMDKFIEKHLQNEPNVTSIGTGGNINKIFELTQPRKNKRYLDLSKIDEVLAHLGILTFEERVNKLNLNHDRADVIIPAGKIYQHVMKAAKSKKMIVPDLGLKDGIIQLLYEKNKAKKPL
ncbi:exopolyphosphatase / guanosine-5'-triphosphate,3'-diphosphate pyrophosphatase [Algoriphagus locisalis]|uniref:Exopolyphosphatase / guanosine-5'-triphosphate,3'-diphosphate pyrophosphatase n=1 Tax=Algoriphagus locisalis TaxID=305507 RepID=A0A1I6YBD3_9BACT|nr:phosphatase [Algoriphagus locisalis]SFT47611.1 exopolyphosphatase / guanosine-5'-triphosphate,3'-diphosphate pyrophosphatase [Algoriphagus locisalis]